MSQIKQIAGRAGRFVAGSSEKTPNVGIVTTLHTPDLPIVKRALSHTVPPLKRAVTVWRPETLVELTQLMPEYPTIEAVDDVVRSCGKLPAHLTFGTPTWTSGVQAILRGLSQAEQFKFSPAPVVRSPLFISIFKDMVDSYREEMTVDVIKCLKKARLLGSIREAEQMKQNLAASEFVSSERVPRLLLVLEDLHKGVVLYIWLAFRFPAEFNMLDEAFQLRAKAEELIAFCLENMADKRARPGITSEELNSLKEQRGTKGIAFDRKPARHRDPNAHGVSLIPDFFANA